MKKEEVRRNTRLGIFVVMGILLFLAGIFYIGSERSLFRTNFPLRANFTDVNGLQKGNNVWLAGVKIGTVKDVTIISDSLVQVEMRINEELQPFIKRNAVAYISSDGLVGNPIVILRPGYGQQVVEANAVLQSVTQTSTQDMINALQATANNINSITNELREMIYDAGEAGTVGSLLTDTTLGTEIKLTIDNIQATGNRSATLTRNLITMVDQLRSNKEGLVQTLLTDTAFARTYTQTLTHLKTASQNTAEVSTELNQIVEKIDTKNNAVGVALNDTTFANNLKETADRLSEGIAKFDENMKAAQHNFLLRRYFKKKRKREEKAKKEKGEEPL